MVPAVGRDICLRARTVPVSFGKNGYVFACANPRDELLREALEMRLESTVELVHADPEILEFQLARLTSSSTGANEGGILDELLQSDIALSEGSSLEEIRRKSQSAPVIKLANNIIRQAIAESATDIHLEPGENKVKVRFRRDGLLKDSMELPKWVQGSLTSRLKILAELDIAEKRLPQDGRIKWQGETDLIDLRVSTLPTRLGEKVVLRILRHMENVAALEALGMPPRIFEPVRLLIHRPQGMLFVTGPTGSGKSSTLYAGLREILQKDINVSTIEDPIEYRLDGANQVQINEKAGLGFAEALRSLLRQDPDVIMVGEIRDEETAAIAVQAAQTGHLVFSTLHTNDAVSAVSRLLDLKVKPFLISSAVLGVLSQRLVRRLCPACHKWEAPAPEEKLLLPDLPESCPTPVGCSLCGDTGYKGRTGIFELLLFDAAVREAILTGKSEAHIKDITRFLPLVFDGIEKLRNGVTSASELLRVAATETQT